MSEITERQLQILEAIIEQHAEIAAPVGSVLLAKLFGVSSATIRSEMAELESLGLIVQPHTSAGRIPTDTGYRLYVNLLNKNYDATKLPAKLIRGAKAITVRASNQSSHANQTIKGVVDSLSELTHNLGVATLGDELYMSGICYLFSHPEFSKIEQMRAVASLLDNLEDWLREAPLDEPLNVYIGSENPIGKNSGASLIISRFRSPYSDKSYIGVIGPTRQNYDRVMGLVRLAGHTLEELLGY